MRLSVVCSMNSRLSMWRPEIYQQMDNTSIGFEVGDLESKSFKRGWPHQRAVVFAVSACSVNPYSKGMGLGRILTYRGFNASQTPSIPLKSNATEQGLKDSGDLCPLQAAGLLLTPCKSMYTGIQVTT